MNRFDTSANGRMPFVLDDIRFQGEVLEFVVSLIMGSLAGQNCILTGCNPIGSIYQSGTVYINGELFEVSGANITSTPAKLVLIETPLISGTKIYGDGSTHQTHINRRLLIENSTASPFFAKLPVKTLNQLLLEKFTGTPFADGVMKNVANKFVTEVIKTAFNKDFGTTAGTVAEADKYWQKAEIPAAEMLHAINLLKLTDVNYYNLLTQQF